MNKFFFVLLILASSCSSRDEQFCECLTAGDAFNEAAAQTLEEEPTSAERKKVQELKNAKEKACAPYVEMSGDEMRKRKADCEE